MTDRAAHDPHPPEGIEERTSQTGPGGYRQAAIPQRREFVFRGERTSVPSIAWGLILWLFFLIPMTTSTVATLGGSFDSFLVACVSASFIALATILFTSGYSAPSTRARLRLEKELVIFESGDRSFSVPANWIRSVEHHGSKTRSDLIILFTPAVHREPQGRRRKQRFEVTERPRRRHVPLQLKRDQAEYLKSVIDAYVEAENARGATLVLDQPLPVKALEELVRRHSHRIRRGARTVSYPI